MENVIKNLFRTLLLVFLCLFQGSACAEPQPSDASISSSQQDPSASVVIKTGAQVLAGSGFEQLHGRRVGLIVNHTAMVDTVHLADLLNASPDVTLAALFGPEHGLRGTADAGETIDDGIDDRTGVPVYSLYGSTRKPTPDMLQEVDVLVFDIQDIGARFYTFISTMGLAMQAAADAGIPFVVLDRPNPIGGDYVSGFELESGQTSFVGQYPIPIAHGMTVGELARMIQGEGMLDGLEGLELQVIPVEGWTRTMLWPETGLPWIPPSPNIPDFETALVYPGAALFEAASASEGRGTRQPFIQLGAPWADGQALADTLNARSLPGVRFEPARFTPVSIEGMATNPKLEGEALQGIRYVITDAAAFQPVEAGIHVFHAFYEQASAKGHDDFIARDEWLAKLSGTERTQAMLETGDRPETIIAAWGEEVEAFRERRQTYLLYE